MPSLNIIGNLNLTGNNQYNRTPFIATGGVVNTFTSGGINYISHTFISGSGTFTILSGETTAQVLAVGAGGAGSSGGTNCNGGDGGGAGGLAYSSSFFFRKNYTVGPSTFIATVAEANNGTPTGSASSFISTYGYEQIAPIIAYGGGSGGGYNGASGGGGGGLAIYGPLGNNGGTGGTAGGGGASVVGADGCYAVGGDGLGFTLQDGTLKYYAGGGGGGGYLNIGPTPGGAGGIGGGGNGGGGVQGPGQPGEANTGGGGGGGNTANDSRDRGNGGAGGSGVIIICYPVNGI